MLGIFLNRSHSTVCRSHSTVCLSHSTVGLRHKRAQTMHSFPASAVVDQMHNRDLMGPMHQEAALHGDAKGRRRSKRRPANHALQCKIQSRSNHVFANHVRLRIMDTGASLCRARAPHIELNREIIIRAVKISPLAKLPFPLAKLPCCTLRLLPHARALRVGGTQETIEKRPCVQCSRSLSPSDEKSHFPDPRVTLAKSGAPHRLELVPHLPVFPFASLSVAVSDAGSRFRFSSVDHVVVKAS